MYGLSGNNLAIGVSLVLRDRFTGGARAAAASMRDLNKEALQAQRQQMEMQRDINAVGAGIGVMAIRGMGQWVKVGAEFGYTMNYVKTIADQKGGIGFDQLSQKAKTLGADTMFTAGEVADAMKYMAMAGQDTENIFNNIGAAVNLAGATMSQLGGKGGTADIMTNIMKGFDIEGTLENSTRVADVLTTATTSANTSLYDLAEAMKYSTSTAKDLNVSLEETAAMVMMAGDAGIQGSMAGTATENMLRYLTRAADETRKGRSGDALKRLGLSPEDLKDAEGNLLSISPLMKRISEQIQGMSDIDAQNVLTDVFGVRGKREASLLLRNMEQYDKYIDKLNNDSTGKAANNILSQMETLQGVGLQVSSSFESLQIAFTESIEPVLKPLGKALTWVLQVLTKMVETPVGAWLTALAAGFVVVKTAVMGYRAIMLSLRLLHLGMGSDFAGSASSITGGYNAMTAAANRYGAAAARASVPFGQRMARRGFGTYTKTSSTGREYSMHGKETKFQKRGTKPQGWSFMGVGKGTLDNSKLGKWGNKIGGGAMLGASLAGMGISMAGDYVGGGTGKALNIGGDALGFAGTGAMIGSIIPGIGTAVGAIVGGVGSLAYSLYTELNKTEQAVEDAKNQAKSTTAKPEFNAENWRKKAIKIRSMYEGDTIYGAGVDPNNLMAATKDSANEYLGGAYRNQGMAPTHITVNIDGKKAMEEIVRKNNYETLISLGGF